METANHILREQRVCIGEITRPFGIKGEVFLRSFTEPPEGICRYQKIFAAKTTDCVIEITAIRAAKNGLIARLSAITTRNQAQDLCPVKIYTLRRFLAKPQEKEEYYHIDLVGLAVLDEAGNVLGVVHAVHNFGAGDLLEIAPKQSGFKEKSTKTDDRRSLASETWFVSFTRETVLQIDLASGQLVVARAAYQ